MNTDRHRRKPQKISVSIRVHPWLKFFVLFPFLLCVAIVLVLSAAACSRDNLLAASRNDSIIHGGLQRTYRIHIPPSHDQTKPTPLLIALHGGFGSGERMEKLTLGGFNTLADGEEFIVVYPDGVDAHWNDGRQVARYRAHKENVDDVGFISALIDHLTGELNIDTKRVYVTGASNGAMMSFRLACELADKIAAIAPVIGALPENLSHSCSPTRPVPVLMINGTEDPLVPWSGGDVRFGPLRLGKVLSVAETVKFWVTHNGCASSPSITWEAGKNPRDGTRVRREVYSECGDESEVILYAIEGGGHTWPSGYHYLPKFFIGRTSEDINACEVIWSFFKKHAIK